MKFKKNIFLNYYKRCDFELTNKERLARIKAHHFDGVFLFADDLFEENVKFCREENLNIETIHLPFRNLQSSSIWSNSELGEKYVNDVISWIKKASANGINKVIFHTHNSDEPEMTEIGFQRINKILKVCEEEKVFLCVENTTKLDYLDSVYEKCHSPYLKGCFDIGHASCCTHNLDTYDYERYQDYIICLHIHDNDGISDLHYPLFNGVMNYKNVMHRLHDIGYSGELTLELLSNPLNDNEDDFLTKAYDSLCKLEEYYNEADHE